MANIYITSVNGQLVAEVNGTKQYEMCDLINRMGWGFGESYEFDYDFDENNDIWTLIDAIECNE